MPNDSHTIATKQQEVTESLTVGTQNVEHISGMADVYAIDIYQKINGISLPIV